MFNLKDFVKMFYEIVDSVTQSGKIVLDHIPNEICVDVKITMRYMVSHSLHSFPRDFRTYRKQLLVSSFVNTLNPFTYCLN